MKYYCNILKKLAKKRSKLKFILECQQYQIIPPHITNITNKVRFIQHQLYSAKFEKSSHYFSIRLIKLEIRQSNTEINFLNATLSRIKDALTTDEKTKKRQNMSYKHKLKNK